MQECSCPQCISACRNDPGRLVPSDIAKIAEFLHIKSESLINEFCVKILLADNTSVALAPAKRKGRRFIAEPGTLAPKYYAEQKADCIFLDEAGLCSIHLVKPFECGAYMGCKNTFLGKPYKDKDVENYFVKKWKGLSRKGQ
jgi:Fe-S-cluster containining protein